MSCSKVKLDFRRASRARTGLMMKGFARKAPMPSGCLKFALCCGTETRLRDDAGTPCTIVRQAWRLAKQAERCPQSERQSSSTPASAYSGHLRASRGWLLLTADAGRESIASAEEGSVCAT